MDRAINNMDAVLKQMLGHTLHRTKMTHLRDSAEDIVQQVMYVSLRSGRVDFSRPTKEVARFLCNKISMILHDKSFLKRVQGFDLTEEQLFGEFPEVEAKQETDYVDKLSFSEFIHRIETGLHGEALKVFRKMVNLVTDGVSAIETTAHNQVRREVMDFFSFTSSDYERSRIKIADRIRGVL